MIVLKTKEVGGQGRPGIFLPLSSLVTVRTRQDADISYRTSVGFTDCSYFSVCNFIDFHFNFYISFPLIPVGLKSFFPFINVEGLITKSGSFFSNMGSMLQIFP